MQIIRQQNATKSHFFDYSLWNHYVKDLSMPLFSAASALSSALLHEDGMCLMYIIRFIGCVLFLLFPLYKFL